MKLNFIITIVLIGLSFCNLGIAQSQQPQMEYKVLDSRYISKEQIFAPIINELKLFDKYAVLKDQVLGKTIPELQNSVLSGDFTYRDLTLFYLSRIYQYDRENPKSLNSVISINPEAILQAERADSLLKNLRPAELSKLPFTVMGMPILLKDNIDVAGMPTTAGAAVMMDNVVEKNARFVNNLIDQNAVILGKTNLSEWAYYFCGSCPSGYSAVGGQTLNPYGRKVIDTGGSSSGSAVAIAAEFAVAAMGTETAGSIISPASQNSVVGVKPGGYLEDPGVIPISHHLDQVGPITRSVIDNAIFSKVSIANGFFAVDQDLGELSQQTLEGMRIGVYTKYLSNESYANAIQLMRENEAIIIELEEKEIPLPRFLTILNADMKTDLTKYFKSSASAGYKSWNISTVINENKKDSINLMPYGQRLFYNVEADATPSAELSRIKENLKNTAAAYYDDDIEKYDLDTIISINNYDAAIAAVAKYMLLTVPMGYNDNGVPFGMTFISSVGMEFKAYNIAAAYEKAASIRKRPVGYFD
jgi:amidase